MNALHELQDWYRSMCDSEWEHAYGVTIESLDNPGWSLVIDLTGTGLEDVQFESLAHGVDENSHPVGEDWLVCTIEDKKFKAAGSPDKLEEMIAIFLRWKERLRSR